MNVSAYCTCLCRYEEKDKKQKKKTQQVLQTTRKANDINKNLCKKCENKAKTLDKPKSKVLANMLST